MHSKNWKKADLCRTYKCNWPRIIRQNCKRLCPRSGRSDPNICVNCPTRHLCTHSKDSVKMVQRHIRRDYEDLADDARYIPKCWELYKRRKETIKRVFADAKENTSYIIRGTESWLKCPTGWSSNLLPQIWKNWPVSCGRRSVPLSLLYFFGPYTPETRSTLDAWTGFLDRLIICEFITLYIFCQIPKNFRTTCFCSNSDGYLNLEKTG